MQPKPPGRPRSEKARLAILQSANRLIAQAGITGLTIEAVAAAAKVGKPTIYRYWANAQELAMAAMMAATTEPTRTLDSQCPLDSLNHQLKEVIARFSTPAGRQAAILMASADSESELSKAFRNQIILQSREQGRVLIKAAIQRGSLPQELSIETVLDMIYGPIFYRLLVGHADVNASLADDIIATLRKTTQKGD